MPLSAYSKFQNAILLCIDANEEMLECEKAYLETFGYTVLTARSGARGLELACIHPVDMVIVDYFMPEMDGQEFALEMKQLRPQAPIIMLSAAADVPKQALKLVDAFIPKADLADALLPAISQLREGGRSALSSYD